MGKGGGPDRRHRKREDDDLEQVGSSHRPKIDPEERDEYEEWRKERGRRGRKRRDKFGHAPNERRRDRSEDTEY